MIFYDSNELDPESSYMEEFRAILDRQILRLISKDIPLVMVQWWHHLVVEATWELESNMQARYPSSF